MSSAPFMKIREVRIHRFGGPEVLQVDHVAPSQPDALQVMVRIKAASINPVDFKIRSGHYPAVNEDRLPYTLGRDAAGVVEKCGAQATRFKVVRPWPWQIGWQNDRRHRKVKPHVQKTFRLEEAASAMAAVESGSSVGKIVLSLE
jgi:NADPH:quinone reductase-like Zn-dependent oxidoreductase